MCTLYDIDKNRRETQFIDGVLTEIVDSKRLKSYANRFCEPSAAWEQPYTVKCR